MRDLRSAGSGQLLNRVSVSAVVFASIPLSITLNLRVRGIPVINGFFLAIVLLISFEYLRARSASGTLLPVCALGGFFMCGVTLLYWDGPSFDGGRALADLLTYAGLPAGVAFAQLTLISDFYDWLRRCYIAVSVTFAISLALLLSGYIVSAGGLDRQLDGAMFSSTFVIAVSFPCVWGRERLSRGVDKLIALSGIGLAAVFAIVSATRSVLIVVVASAAFAVIVQVKRNKGPLIWLSPVALLLGIAVFTDTLPGMTSLGGTILVERLASTNYESEIRYEELASMVEQMGRAEWIHGVGFGTGFVSPVYVDSESGLALAPHIGITTLLYKGGVPAFLALMIMPCFYALFKFAGRSNSEDTALAAGAAIYVLQASMSGGWGFIPLFFLGAFLKLSVVRRSRRSGGRESLMTVTRQETPRQPATTRTEVSRAVAR